MFNRILLFLSILLGVSSVFISAYIDHGMKSVLTAEQLDITAKAIRYHQVYSMQCMLMAILMIFVTSGAVKRILCFSLFMFLTATILFSGSLYAFAGLGFDFITVLTPIGGISYIIAWLLLLPLVFVAQTKSRYGKNFN